MHLEKLKIKGFKSFAESVELDLSGGISAIVGPNGSGKSNITDAIRWVLGEQSTKALRGKKMEDVIFAGTAQKGPLGYAEVILILDNQDKTLSEYPEELHIMRRLFRSGESEYRINNRNCKLKEIQQIFMDTGLGKNGYSLISQGAIEDIISSGPAELRTIVEEAVGIVNYKTRKIEAEKKLVRTQDNMDRVNDILEELKKRRTPLKKQADKARDFLSIHEELKITDLYLFVKRMDEIEAESTILDRQAMDTTVEINSIQHKLLSLDRQFQNKQSEAQALSEKLNADSEAQHTLETEINACTGEILVGEERLKHLEAAARRLIDESEKQRVFLEKYLEEKGELSEKILSAQNELLALQDEISSVKDERSAIEGQNEKLRLQMEDQMQAEASAAKRKTQLNEEIQRIRDRISAERVRQKISEEACARYQTELAQESDNARKTEEKLRETQRYLNEKKQTCKEHEKEKQAVEAKLTVIEQKLNVLRNNMQVNLKQQDYLKRIQEKYSDYYPGIQKVMTSGALSAQDRKAIFGPVGELISVPEKFARAIEVALGSKAQNIVVATVETASRCIDLLKKEKAGRVTFLPMDHLKVRGVDPDDRAELKKADGFVGIASELIQFEPKYQIAVDSVLSRILVVRDFHTAKKISSRFSKYTIVTIEGEIFHVGGAIVGGANKGGKQAPFFKKLEIERLSQEYAEGEKAVKALEDQQFTLTQKKMAAANSIREDKAAAAAKEQLIWQLKQKQSALSEHCAEIRAASEREQCNCEAAKNILKESEGQMEQLNQELRLFEEADDAEKTDDLKERLTEKLRDIERLLTGLQIREAQKTEQLKALTSQHSEIENRIEGCHLALENNADELNKAEKEAESQREQIVNNRKSLDAKKNAVKDFDERVNSFRKTQTVSGQEMMTLSQKIQDGNHELVVLNEAKNKLERQMDRLSTEKDHLEESIYARYTLNLLMARDILETAEVCPEKLTEENQRILRHKMNALGQVNLSAIEEYAEVSERYTFLKTQLDDLIAAKGELEKIIRQLYLSMEKQFAEGFEKLQGYFSEVFAVLFDGGEAHLSYSDPAHIMESGIELTAQPPGKKLRHISLLSGGETAMTAIALLFAFLRLNPSPFCVIDEIDAALDDGNIQRFTNYMCSLADHIQFMLITHRKKTLEACDAIYGVTMSKTGISKLLSIRLSDYVENNK